MLVLVTTAAAGLLQDDNDHHHHHHDDDDDDNKDACSLAVRPVCGVDYLTYTNECLAVRQVRQ